MEIVLYKTLDDWIINDKKWENKEGLFHVGFKRSKSHNNNTLNKSESVIIF